MAVIDVGTKDTYSGSLISGYSRLNPLNPANDTGYISTFQLQVATNATGVKMGTFYGATTSWTMRDYELLGAVTGGSLQTFSGLNCDVETDDIVGAYTTTGNLGYHADGAATRLNFNGDTFDGGTDTYASGSGAEMILYGEGISVTPGNPDAPTTPSPANAGTGTCEDQYLSCVVTDPASTAMTVRFYDESDDSLIGTDTGVASGGTATVLAEGLTPGATFTWYAVADNGTGTTQGADWSFTVGEEYCQVRLSEDNTFRRYQAGIKILEYASTLLTFFKTIDIISTTDPQLRLTHTDGVDETDFYTNSDGELVIMPTSRTIYLGDGTAGDSVFGFYGNTSIFTLIHDDSESDLKLSANDVTNYTKFAGDGIMTLHGTARVNKEFSLLLSDFNPGASGPTKALNGIFPTYEFTIDDDMHTSFEMPDDWADGTDITVEVYWAIDEAYATNSGEVRWSADWRAVAVGELISGGSSGTMDFGDVNIPATANTIVKTTSTISGASLAADDLVAFNGARIDLVAGNDPTAEPYIIAVRLEYIADKLGEAT